MIIIAWTGSRPPDGGFSIGEQNYVYRHTCSVIRAHGERLQVLTGGCIGIDDLVTHAAHELCGVSTRAILPYRGISTTAWETLRKCQTLLDYSEVGPTLRDKMIVEQASEVHAIGLLYPRRLPRSGTWATARMAQRAGKLKDLIVLRPAVGATPRKYEGADWCLCNRDCACGRPRLEN